MPYKFHDSHRGKFQKGRYRVTNWRTYNESLRRRGDLTIWVSEDVAQEWMAARRRTRGGQRRYFDLAIEICLTLRVAFRLALRQTQGFMQSIAKLMGLALPVPDFSTLSRRGKSLKVAQKGRVSDKPITLIVDSTGLKVHSEIGWNGHKHGAKGARKTWRKLHLALDPDSGDILASELTTEHVGDETALPILLGRVDAPVGRFLADGAYDGPGVSDCLAAAFGYEVDVVVPPPKNAVPGGNCQRNQHIEHIAKHGRMTWQAATGYNQRSRIETQIGRWKSVIGDRLHARNIESQTTETHIAANALNRMSDFGRANYERVS
ncbi:IS5 family transposase [Rhizobium sp. AP16]|uniref:IS5 family transposase n=1 Tax=Rhizobium sp. AP16 TaxID=1144306 RepID=UPI00026EE3F5|nr:IS5 family transposase [Rhizobium sp. AP16]EJK88382.1 transposase family protein [Rhizobium sp. AP16]